MAFLDIDGFQFNYEKFTGVGAFNTLFIHGNLASKEWWHPSIEIMKSQSTGTGTLMTADWRGYGESKGITDVSEIDFRRFALDYVELLEKEGLKDVNVVGHSTGGLI
ncbi:MAG: alpha/beta hydrolase, partial [Bdellovibrionales bacterium]|nr:alpha/beta hydrolase [Bdellovibrionales bacterium]